LDMFGGAIEDKLGKLSKVMGCFLVMSVNKDLVHRII